MILAAASLRLNGDVPELVAGPALDLDALVLGRPVAEVAALLPRLFNLCRAAQGLAAAMALGLPSAADPVPEAIRDHALSLAVTVPRALGLQPTSPANPAALLGGGLPGDLAGLAGWDAPAAALVEAVDAAFAANEAVCDPLPPPTDPLAAGAFENSAPGRQSAHPLLRQIETRQGRGPLWRLVGLMADLQAALDGRMPPAQIRAGVVSVPTARGTYGLALEQAGGRLTRIRRRTPTDHLLAPGGALLRSLQRLPPARRALAPVVIALLDPCIPLSLGEVGHA